MLQKVVSEVAPTIVRVRLKPSRKLHSERCASVLDSSSLLCSSPGQQQTPFKFDSVYGEQTGQAKVFSDLAALVDAALTGLNGTICAYGQTGSGKTHTLFGNVAHLELQGVVPRAIAHLGRGILQATEEGVQFKVTVTIVEIYCERVRCLLSSGRDNLQIRTDQLRGVFVDGAEEVEVRGEGELSDLLEVGLAGRSVSATNMNEESSRSHCVVTIWVERSMPDGQVQLGKLVLVDLAGSERASKTGAQTGTLAEGALINKSLSCLANVIFALTDTRCTHVPYRDSKLTRVLQDSLAGNARTVLICCISAESENAAETLCTLRFADRARGLPPSKLQVNQRRTAESLQQMILVERAARAELQTEINGLKEELAACTGTATATANQPLTHDGHGQSEALLLDHGLAQVSAKPGLLGLQLLAVDAVGGALLLAGLLVYYLCRV